MSAVLFATQLGANAASTLAPGQILQRGQFLQSNNARYTLNMQSDGSLVMYRNDGAIRYSMAKNGSYAIMQSDGNFVEYSNTNTALWNTGTWGNSGSWLNVQDDGNLVVYRSNSTPIWNIGAEPSPSDPTKVGDVVGRDLAVPGGSYLGHTGLWDGGQVVEAHSEDYNTIRMVSLQSFKSASPYWGKASPNIADGLMESRCYLSWCSTNGSNHEIVEARVAAAKTSFQAYLLGADYTKTASYVAPQFADQYRPAKRGVFRCDTFIIYVLETTTSYRLYPRTAAQNLWRDRFFSIYDGNITPKVLFDKLKTFQ